MPHCCVPECNNYWKTGSKISFHKIPKDLRLRKAWLERIRRENLPALENCYVCSEHFSDDCYEKDLKSQLMPNTKFKRKLLPGSIPSLFNFVPPPKQPRLASEARANRQELQQIREEVLLQVHTSTVISESAGNNELEIEHCTPIENPTTRQTPMDSSGKKTNDVGTQCCVGAKYTITRTIATQTDENNFSDKGIQVDMQPKCRSEITLYEQVYPSEDEPISSPLASNYSDDLIGNSDSDFTVSDKEESDLDNADQEKDTEPNQEQTFLVFHSCLKNLLHFCPRCGSVVLEVSEKSYGSMLYVSMRCMNNHDVCWTSQPVIKKIAGGNLLASAAILFSGNTFARIAQFASFLKLKFFSQTTYYNIQNKYLFPVVDKAWIEERATVIDNIKKNGPVNLIGDGRCDSPGHNAKYCTYTVMTEQGKVTHFNLVQVTEVSSSNAMEKEGFERCVTGLQNDGIVINRITTDRHTSIASAMNKNHPDIKHQFDLWHLSKWIVKQLSKKAKRKGYEELFLWIKSVSNHLWWCSATCGGSAEVLQEKWKSILYHISNKHKWNGNSHFHECAHPCLDLTTSRKKKWLKPNTPPYIALEEVVLNKKLLKDLSKVTEFCHTGELEVYHAELLKYCPKREHFSYKGMTARSQLAALDHNANTGRKQAVAEAGPNKGEARYKISFTKTQKQWVAKPIKEKKSYIHIEKLLADVVKACCHGKADHQPQQINIPKNIAKAAAPSKPELVQALKSRFNN